MFLLWCVAAAVSLAAPSPAQLLLGLLLSPLTALALWALLKLSGFTFYFIPGINKVWGYLRLGFRLAFSRVVVEEAPMIEMPLWP